MGAEAITEHDFDIIFRDAHTANGWKNQAVSEELLRKIYDAMKWGPTSANTCPLRIVFIRDKDGKEKLKPCLDPGNVDKTMAAPVTALFAHDMKFYERMGELAPHNPKVRSWFEGNDALIQETAFRNGTLQAGYFMIAARANGLDCGPMSGFNKAKADAAFFPDGRFKSNFLCSLGYADPSKTHPRAPRLKFEDVCRFT
jgi:3-hydroxypropanoate dehydrogenase